MFGYPGASPPSGCCSMPRGKPRADVGARLLLQLRRPESSSLPGEGRHPGHQSDQPLRPHRAGVARVADGLTIFEGTFQVAVPELAGTIAPTVVGSKEKVRDPETGLTVVVRKPIASRVAIGRPPRRRVRRAAHQGQSRQARRARLLQLPARQGEHRRQLSERRRVDRQHPAAAEAGGLRRRHRGSVAATACCRHPDKGAQRRRLRAGRAGGDARAGQRRARRLAEYTPLARCAVAGPERQDAQGLGRAGEVAADDRPAAA